MAEDKTITDAPAEQTGAQDALPADQTDQATAATDDSQQQQVSEDDQPQQGQAQQVDDSLKRYADSHGIILDSEGAVKAAKIAMDNQASYQRTNQKATELEKNLTTNMEQSYPDVDTNDPQVQLAMEVQALKLKDQVRTWFDGNKDAEPYRVEMARIAKENPDIQNLNALYAMAVQQKPELLKSQGGREALQSLAGKQQAAAVNGSAINPAPTKPTDDPFLRGLTSDN